MKKMYKTGVHTFYRPRAWGNGSDAPSWGNPAETADDLRRSSPKPRKARPSRPARSGKLSSVAPGPSMQGPRITGSGSRCAGRASESLPSLQLLSAGGDLIALADFAELPCRRNNFLRAPWGFHALH